MPADTQTIAQIVAPTHTSLAAAFLAAQQTFGALTKSTDGQRGKYSPLDKVLAALVPKLNDQGISVRQITKVDGDMLVVETTLTHVASGEQEASTYPVGTLNQPHQNLGAGLTYARRYGLMAHCGIYPEGEDKDGANAGRAGRAKEQAPADLDAAVAQMRVKILNCAAIDDLERVWSSNHKLRGALGKQQPDDLARLEGAYKTRKHELSGKRGTLFEGEQ